MSRPRALVHAVLALAAVALLAVSFGWRYSAEAQLAEQVRLAQSVAPPGDDTGDAEETVVTEEVVPSRRTFSDLLLRAGIEPATAHQIVLAATPVFDLRRVRAGNAFAIGRSVEGDLRNIRYQVDAENELWITPAGDGFTAEVKTIPTSVEVLGVTGTIQSSLFNAVADAGESPEIALLMADIFGWDLDFYTDPRPGDTFRLVVEKKKYLDGRTAGYGRLLAAEYVNGGTPYQAVLFRDPTGDSAYYAPDGKSLKKAFLRSPLKFSARISSRFTHRRFHPVLRRYRPHLGVDYAAPTGTPVQAIGEGRVVFAGWKGGGGRTVQIRHSHGYETFYLHLSRIRVRNGQRVSQGQIIGLVGSTGLATGPHLDFRIRQHGRFRNFQTLRLPPTGPVAEADRAEFEAVRDQYLALLPPLATPGVELAGSQPAASLESEATD